MTSLLACLLIVSVVSLTQGQQYSSQPQQQFNIPPLRTIEEYKRLIEDDIYAVERKAELVASRECISGKEQFYFCSLDLNILDFMICILNPAKIAGADALSRGVKFPSNAFGYTPSVAVGIGGIGTVVFGDVKVVPKDVTSSGFNIAITGGTPAFPYSLSIVWIACPANYPVSVSVRDYTPKAVPPPPPYFPPVSANNEDSITITDNTENDIKLSSSNSQALFDDKDLGYEESSQSVDDESGTQQPPYVQKPERYGETEKSDNKTTSKPPTSNKTA